MQYTNIYSSTLKWYEETHVKDPIEKRGFDGNYWLWDYPNYSRDYVVVADVARGDSTDYSAFHVFDVENVEQVAEYKGKIETKQYGAFLTSVATDWNNALLVIENANIGWAVIQEVIDRNLPLFGICLGHQIIGQIFGSRIVQAKELVHGKTSNIISYNKGILKNLPQRFEATRYHSLVVDKKTLSKDLTITSITSDGTIMGVMHKKYKIHGVQFHPESIKTKYGLKILENFVKE